MHMAIKKSTDAFLYQNLLLQRNMEDKNVTGIHKL